MTATSLIVQRHAAHLLTDGAFYETDGTITEIKSKVACNAPLRMAVAVSGCLTAHRFACAFGSGGTLENALRCIPDCARELRTENAVARPEWNAGDEGLADFQLFVAAWSDRHQRAVGYALSSNAAWFGEGYAPFTLSPVDAAIAPPVSKWKSTLPFFRPKLDGLAILQEQRLSSSWGDQSYVGGFGELTTVTIDGIRSERLVDWPDKVGERVAL